VGGSLLQATSAPVPEPTPRFVRYQDVHYVYILRSAKDGNLYTGYSADLRKPLADHNAGKARTTRHRRPLQLIYYEAHLLSSDAKAREIFLKSGAGKRYIRKQLSHYLSAAG
jgi:putative endonuclease